MRAHNPNLALLCLSHSSDIDQEILDCKIFAHRSETSDNGRYINVDNVGTAKINGENVLYLEIEKYNTMNELTPFAMNTSSSYNNSYNGKVNTAFTKIILDDQETTSSRNNTSKTNKIVYNQLVKNIDRLKFKFRYHSGLLIDLADNDLHFTLVFYSVKQSNHHLRLD